MMRGREFELTDRHFEQLRGLVYRHTGISLSEAKRELVRRRFSPRLRELELQDFSQYCEMVDRDGGEELVRFTNAITTNLTSFFRENHHFEYLKNQIIPNYAKTKGHRRLRIWSAGCSTGEEPYSIAMSLHEAIPDMRSWDIKILATDIDTDILAKASAGVYIADKVDNLTDDRISRYFLKGKGGNAGKIQANSRLKELIHFRHLNLMNEWPMSKNFDVIFCRNVVIYFDLETKKRLIERYWQKQAMGDYLFLGHSESLHKVTDCYHSLGQTIYQKH